MWRRQAHDRTGLERRCAARFPPQQQYSEFCIHNSLYCGVPAEGIRRTGSGGLGLRRQGHTTARPMAHARCGASEASPTFGQVRKNLEHSTFTLTRDAQWHCIPEEDSGAANALPERPSRQNSPTYWTRSSIYLGRERTAFFGVRAELNTTVKQCAVESIGGPLILEHRFNDADRIDRSSHHKSQEQKGSPVVCARQRVVVFRWSAKHYLRYAW